MRLQYRYDTQVYLWSIVYFTALVGSIVLLFAYWGGPYAYLIMLLLGLLVAMPIATLPLSFEETDRDYTVHLLLFTRRFSKEKYTAEASDKSVFKDAVRTFSSGGAFGYTGYWWSPLLGDYIFSHVASFRMPLLLLTSKSMDKKGRRQRIILNGTV